MRMLAAACALMLCGIASAAADDPFAQTRMDWNRPHQPFRVIGNVYYVGAAGVSAFLIRTPAGDILTDGGLPESAPLIEKNIRALGVKLSDVKILLNSHAHFDHAGGLAKLKRDIGARLIASAADKPILEKGRIGFGPSATDPFPPVKVDRAVKDGDTVDLGGVTLTAHVTPGHTPGCTDWTMPIVAGGQNHTVIFFCSLTVAGNPLVNNKAYPGIAADYKASFAKLKKIDADIFLAPHAEQFGLAKKVATLQADEKNKVMNAPNPFIDKGEFHRVVGAMEKDFDAELAKQQAAAGK